MPSNFWSTNRLAIMQSFSVTNKKERWEISSFVSSDFEQGITWKNEGNACKFSNFSLKRLTKCQSLKLIGWQSISNHFTRNQRYLIFFLSHNLCGRKAHSNLEHNLRIQCCAMPYEYQTFEIFAMEQMRITKNSS